MGVQESIDNEPTVRSYGSSAIHVDELTAKELPSTSADVPIFPYHHFTDFAQDEGHLQYEKDKGTVEVEQIHSLETS